MWFLPFFFRTLRLSLIVSLYWLPVLVIVNYGAYQIFLFFQSEPIALAMVIFLLVQPYFVIQGILAIRGGMMALDVTNGADLNMLGTVTVRVLRFNLPLIWAVTALFGLAVTVTGFRITGSTWAGDVGSAFGVSSKADAMRLLGVLAEFPIILLGGWVVGFAASMGLMGVATAGASAMAASRPPSHHNIWGIASEFMNLFLTTLVLLTIPYIGAIALTGGIDTTIGDLVALGDTVVYGFTGYILWSVCAISAAIALAYSLTLTSEAEKHKAMMDVMSGAVVAEKVDLKSLRESRMKK